MTFARPILPDKISRSLTTLRQQCRCLANCCIKQDIKIVLLFFNNANALPILPNKISEPLTNLKQHCQYLANCTKQDITIFDYFETVMPILDQLSAPESYKTPRSFRNDPVCLLSLSPNYAPIAYLAIVLNKISRSLTTFRQQCRCLTNFCTKQDFTIFDYLRQQFQCLINFTKQDIMIFD